jgi:hypothetical protein
LRTEPAALGNRQSGGGVVRAEVVVVVVLRRLMRVVGWIVAAYLALVYAVNFGQRGGE